MDIFVVRHGETVGNVEKRHQGRADYPLTEKGLSHAKEIAEILKNKGIKIVYSSTLKRALDTAEIISSALNVALEPRTEIEEISFGILDGLKKDEIKAKYPGLVAERDKDKINCHYPEGESYSDVKKRLGPFFDELCAAGTDGSIAIVGHEAVNRTLIALLLKLSDAEMLSIIQPNNCVYLIDLDASKIYSLFNGKKIAGWQKR